VQVAVVGAGIVGASVAYHLARGGVAVSVVEKAQPASGATGSSFAWIGDNGSGPAAVLHHGALRDYRRLEAELASVRVRWTGSLSWSEGPLKPGAPGSGPDPGCCISAAEISALEPHLRRPPQQAIYAPGDGAIDPVAVTRALLQAAGSYGAQALQATVIGVRTRGGQMIGLETSGGFLQAERVVLAAGTGIRALCSPLGVDLPVEASPALLVRCSAPSGLVRTLVATPDVEARQSAAGDLLAAVPYDGLDTAQERQQAEQRVLAQIKALFCHPHTVTVTSSSVGIRPVPADGMSIVGPLPRSPGVYVAVVWPGVQLAPIVGRLVAEEIIKDADTAELQPCRPARFIRAQAGMDRVFMAAVKREAADKQLRPAQAKSALVTPSGWPADHSTSSIR
jgi:glycine/D-amino acid oxidase-like deaminating enzyme